MGGHICDGCRIVMGTKERVYIRYGERILEFCSAACKNKFFKQGVSNGKRSKRSGKVSKD